MKRVGIIFWFLVAMDSFAQSPKCYVYTIIGNATVMKDGKPAPLQQGSLIFDEDLVTIPPSTTLTLLDHKNKFIIIDQPGKYKYEGLQKVLNVRPTGITKKYFDFMWEDLVKPHGHKEAISARVIGGVTGGAKRGDCIPDLFEPPNDFKSDEDTINFCWAQISGAKSYQFVLLDSSNSELINIIIKDTSIAMLKRNLTSGERSLFHWTALALGKRVNDCTNDFMLFSSGEKQSAVNLIVQNVKNEGDEFLYYIKLSESLANKGWQKDATEYYKKARTVLTNQKSN